MSKTSGSDQRSALPAAAVIILLVVSISILPLLTLRSTGTAAEGDFSVARAMDHVLAIAAEPHPMGSAANADVRRYLVDELTALGLDPETQQVEAPDYFGAPGDIVSVVNVMAKIPGTSPTKAVVLVAHYDSDPSTPGANDDAVGLAAILEAARLLIDGPAVRNDVIVLLTDGEEPAPRFGSRAFVAEHPWATDVGFVANFEAAGGSGPAMVVESNGPGEWLIGELAESMDHPVVFAFLTEAVELIGGIGTDFDPFVAEQVPGIHVAYARGTPIYHTSADNPDSVDRGSMEHHGEYALSVARHFGSMDLSQPPPDGDAVFFTLGRGYVVHYPTSWAIPLSVLVAVVSALVVAMHIRREGPSLKSVLAGVAVAVACLVVAVTAPTVTWLLLTGVRSSPGVAESYIYLFGLIGIGSMVGGAAWRLAERRWARVELRVSVLLLWAIFALVSNAFTPGIGYLFVWPVLVSSVAFAWMEAGVPRGWRHVPLILVAVPSLILVVPAIDTFFQLALPRPGNPDSEVVETVAVVVLLAVLVGALIGSAMRGHWLRPDQDR